MDVHRFVTQEGIASIACCRTGTGYLSAGMEAEVRIAALLQMIPGLEVVEVENEHVAHWALREKPPIPADIADWQRGLAPLRAIEVAQFRASALALAGH